MRRRREGRKRIKQGYETKKYGDYSRFLSGVKKKMPYIAKNYAKTLWKYRQKAAEAHRTAFKAFMEKGQ